MEEMHTTQLIFDGCRYTPPQILLELELETRAGSSLGLPDGFLDTGE